MLPAIGLGLLVLSAILLGGVYPAIIQQFVVKPNELAKESPFLSREIAATRTAWGVSGVQVTRYSAVPAQPPAAAGQRGGRGARPAAGRPRRAVTGVPAAPAGQELLPVRPGAGPRPLPVPGGSGRPAGHHHRGPRDERAAGRARPAGSTPTWSTPTATGSSPLPPGRSQANGNPVFTESDIPPSGGQLGSFQPRIYFGRAGDQLRDRRGPGPAASSTTPTTTPPAASTTAPITAAAACRSGRR